VAPWASEDLLEAIGELSSSQQLELRFTAFSAAYRVSDGGHLLTAVRPAALRPAICNQGAPMSGERAMYFAEFTE
jgi:hypothetical protein